MWSSWGGGENEGVRMRLVGGGGDENEASWGGGVRMRLVGGG